MGENAPRRALISVSDKTGLLELAQGLVELGFEIVSTGGTRRHLEENDLPVINVSQYTGFPEIMNGRVKSLHPKIHGAILGMPDNAEHLAAMQEHGIVPFELVVCNLYPFEKTIADEHVTLEEAVEQIDIGGPSMVRSAAKNHKYVGIVTSPNQYSRVLEALSHGSLSVEFRKELAVTAFEHTACYDQAITNYLKNQMEATDELANHSFPNPLLLSFKRKQELRYGENPHQQAAFYVENHAPIGSLASAKQLNGKDLSYNNLFDLDAALSIVSEFTQPASVVIKHSNPCGCALGENGAEAFIKAHAGDPVSAFGSIVGFNRPVDATCAEMLCRPDQFLEAIIAPAFDAAALEIIKTKPKWKKNVRILECPLIDEALKKTFDFRRLTGGLLVQNRDLQADPEGDFQVVTERLPSDEELQNLKFAWRVCKHVKSNAIVLAKDFAIFGVGAGQMSRLDSSIIAVRKAGERSQGSVVASDAFFPFRDGVDQLAQSGMTAVIQPGGSRNDNKVIEACDEQNLAMVFTGRRHFKH